VAAVESGGGTRFLWDDASVTPREPTPDPGWGGIKHILLFMLPGGAQLAKRQADALVATREIFVSFCTALALFGVVLVFLGFDGTRSQISDVVAAGIVVVIGVATLALRMVFGNRSLDCAGVVQLRTSYRSRFFLRMAIAEVAALCGFVLTFMAEASWLYFVGAAFTAVGFAAAAPTRRQLARDQARLTATGCSLDLVAAIRGVD
jgi:hypothetical protein